MNDVDVSITYIGTKNKIIFHAVWIHADYLFHWLYFIWLCAVCLTAYQFCMDSLTLGIQVVGWVRFLCLMAYKFSWISSFQSYLCNITIVILIHPWRLGSLHFFHWYYSERERQSASEVQIRLTVILQSRRLATKSWRSPSNSWYLCH